MPKPPPDLEGCVRAVRLWEPHVRALLDWDEPAALARAAGAGPGPLAGWPLAVKDIIDVAGLPTRCNADFVPAGPAAANAAIVDELLALGTFFAAKSVTTTFAYFDPGPTRNPWGLDHTPGGSSSGSAAAVACGMARLALGTQTVGSINRPASFCGVVGFKPTLGRLPTAGVFPVAPTVDTVGCFTANVADARTVFHALTGEGLPAVPARLRIGCCADLRCEPPEAPMARAVADAAAALAGAGHDVTTLVLPGQFAGAYEHHWVFVARETADSHRALYDRYGDGYTLRLRELIERGRRIPDDCVRRARAHRDGLMASFAELARDVDVVLAASAPGPAPRGLTLTGDPRMNLLSTYLGCPSLTLPAALSDDGLPLGIQLLAAPMRDAALLAAGSAVEQVLAFDHQPAPP